MGIALNPNEDLLLEAVIEISLTRHVAYYFIQFFIFLYCQLSFLKKLLISTLYSTITLLCFLLELRRLFKLVYLLVVLQF